MPGRTLLFSLLILMFPPAVGLASTVEPTRPAIIVELPATMTAADVAKFAEELRAKGATLAPPVTAAAPEAERGLVARIARRLQDAAPAIERFPELKSLWLGALARDGRAPDRHFWPRAVGLLAAALLVELLIREALSKAVPRLRIEPGTPLLRAFARHGFRVALGLAGFLLVLRVGAGFLGQGSPLLAELGDRIIELAGDWRIVMAVLTVLAAPRQAEARPLFLDDAGARQMTGWINAYLLSSMALVTGIWLIDRLGGDDMALIAAFAMGLILLVFKIAMVLRLRRSIAGAILAAGGPEAGRTRRAIASGWHYGLIALSMVIFVLALEEYALGNNPRAGLAAAALQTAVVGMTLIWAAKRRFVLDYERRTRSRWWQPVANRTIDVVVLLGGMTWLAHVWGYGVLDAAPGTFAATVLRPMFKAVATLSIAWLIWAAIGGFLGERIPQHRALGDEEDPAAPAVAMTRLATLLPLIRNTLAIAVFFLGGMIALGDLGVDIGPLLAGAGVVGIALGFGAQALVRDVIAGLFFLIDDAFRLGEYIDTGRLKGTVEAISIRSVRLRHQNGQIHTIPFGQIQAVTNSSRDWAVVKFNLHIAPDSDLELVRKTVKQLGLALLQDPEIGADFIQPLKMQGVVDVTLAAIMIRCKFTARPVRPSYLQRQALRELIRRFTMAEIAFATPPANASNPI